MWIIENVHRLYTGEFSYQQRDWRRIKKPLSDFMILFSKLFLNLNWMGIIIPPTDHDIEKKEERKITEL